MIKYTNKINTKFYTILFAAGIDKDEFSTRNKVIKESKLLNIGLDSKLN